VSGRSNPLSGLEIAVVGMATRVPGARNPEELWRNVRDGVESITFLAPEALVAAGVDPTLLDHPRYVRAAAVLDGVDRFDAAFFGYSPREAEILDPQHRLFLECAWEALEDAGCSLESVKGSAGVYAGVGTNGYFLNNLARNAGFLRAASGFQLGIGNDKDHLSPRVSYKLDLQGPAVTVQTACSTSLVAVHLACQALLAGECDLALAGGVSIAVPHGIGYLYEEGGILSPDGHCRAFDERAQGCLGGSGAGVVVLKRLEAALAEGDGVRAVIKGSAINNDGSSKVGYTAPGLTGQAKAIRRAQKMAGVTPDTVTYVEAHGTGTALGDPIEISALTRAFRSGGARGTGFCAVGSVKTNVGHLDTAAGVTGLIKTVLALEHRQIPPTLHFERPSQRIDFASSPFYVSAELADWRSDGPRRAGVSSFGIGGTNAHVVLEEAPEAPPTTSSRPRQLFVLSARTPAALAAATTGLAAHLRRHPELHPAEVAWTLQAGRRAFDHRRAVVARGLDDLVEVLESPGSRRLWSGGQAPAVHSVAFLFPGQGAQHPGMAADLYAGEPVFRSELDRCAELLVPHLGRDLRRSIYPDPDMDPGAAALELADTRLAQPALFAVEYALARLWMDWGIQPAALLGHSIGEYVAACLSGVLSLEGALRLVAARGRLLGGLPRGAMLSVPLPEAEVVPFLAGGLSLAAVNGSALCVLSGPDEEIAAVSGRLRARGIDGTRLHTSHAFHSAMLDPVLPAFRREVEQVELGEPEIPYLSNLTGTWIKAEEAADPDYWVCHLRETVRFEAGLSVLLRDPSQALLEVGPGGKLAQLASRHPQRDPDQPVLASLPHPRNPESEAGTLLTAAARLWVSGVPMEWPKLHVGERLRRVTLPTYPFERQRYWVEPEPHSSPERSVAADTAARKPDVKDWLYAPLWRQTIPPAPLGSVESISAGTRWLIFMDGSGLGEALSTRLVERRCQVVRVRTGHGFERLGEGLYQVAPERREDYVRLLGALAEEERAPRHILHLWGVEPADGEDPADRDRCLQQGFFSLLALAQALGEQAMVRGAADLGGIRIDVVSTQVQRVGGDEDLLPEKAALLGPCRVIPKEYPGVSCRAIDISLPVPGSRAFDLLLDRLTAELLGEANDPLISYRAGQRWIPTFEPVALPGEGASAPRLREGGVYLITGGLGGVGLALAEHLAGSLRARLALLGRSALPAREEWPRYMAAGGELGSRLQALLRIEELGSEVLILRADVTDPAAVRRAAAEVRARFGAIHGVVHAAGEPPGGIMQLKTPEAAAAVLAAKVAGTRRLAEALAEDDLDVLVLCSSLSSVLGEPGRVDYTAANAFLDAFAARQAAQGRTLTVAIGWDGWSGVGMSARKRPETDADRAALADALSTDEGFEVFQRILSGQLPHVLVSTRDFTARLRENRDLTATDLLARLEEGRKTRPLHPRPALSVPFAAPESETERLLGGLWQDLLGIEAVGVDDDFFELGGDSLIGLQVIARAGEAGLKLTVGQLFEHPTLRALAVVVGSGASAVVVLGAVAGPVPLTPIQSWFFEQELEEAHHWNQSQLLEIREPLSPLHLAAAVRDLVRRHDALRLRFERDAEGWRQRDGGTPVPAFAWADLSVLTREGFRTALETDLERLQASLDLERGPLFRVVLFTRGTAQGRLLLLAHHLAVDVVSWGVLIEELQVLYRQHSRGEEPRLSEPVSAFTPWAAWLAAHAASAELEADASFWLIHGSRPSASLPVDRPYGRNTAASTRTLITELSAEETLALTREIPAAARLQAQELLLTALARALSSWTGGAAHRIELEGHGRDGLASGFDLSRTVGWFTSLYPVVLDLTSAADPGAALRNVQQELRDVRGRESSYGLLRHLAAPAVRRELGMARTEVVFAYLGEVGQTLSGPSPLRLAPESAGRACSPRGLRSQLLAVSAAVLDGRMTVHWTYSANLHLAASIEALAASFLTELRTLASHCLDVPGDLSTSLDFQDSGLSQDELDRLLSAYSEPGI
jgi:non-ribosomal peptide synthase protein (TIGR01720 family)